MLIDEQVSVAWHGNNRSYYENLGYVYTKKGDIFLVSSLEIQKGSTICIKYRCDHCSMTFELKMNKYSEKECVLDLCKKCGQLNKFRKLSLDGRQKATDWKDIVKLFLSRGHILLSSPLEYKNINSKLNYICKKHPFSLRSSTFRSYSQNKNCCTSCQVEMQTGELSHFWREGITAIGIFIRSKLERWKKDSMVKAEFKCKLTGGIFHDIHHLYPFSKILEEVFQVSMILKKPNLIDYSKEELEVLIKTAELLHSSYPLGVCLSEETHKLFHKVYGNKNNTPEQFYEFENDFKDGKYLKEI